MVVREQPAVKDMGILGISASNAIVRVVGWSAYWAWLLFATVSDGLIPESARTSPFSFAEVAFMATMLSFALTRALLVVCERHLLKHVNKVGVRVLSAASLSCGTLVLILGGASSASEFLAVFGALLIAVGAAFLSTLWAILFSRCALEEIAAEVSLGFFIAITFSLGVSAFPPLVVQLMALICPLVSTFLLSMAMGDASGPILDKDARGSDSLEQRSQTAALASASQGVTLAYAVLLFVGIVCYGLAGSVVRSISQAQAPSPEALVLVTNFHTAGTGIISVLFCIIASVRMSSSKPMNITITNNVILVFLALSMLVPSFFGSNGLYVGNFVNGTGIGCFNIVLVLYASVIISTRRFSPFKVMFVAFGSMEVAGFLGFLLGRVLGAGMDEGGRLWTTFALGALFVLMLVAIAIFIPFEKRILVARGDSPEDASDDSAGPAGTVPVTQSFTRESLAWLQEEYGLTNRELDVALLLASGRNIPAIQKVLTISRGTAQTHAFHIHQKLGVHSQQELIDLVTSRDVRD